jgi:hypothetical protein
MNKKWKTPLVACVAWASMLLPSLSALGQVDIDKTAWHVVFEDDFNDPSTIGPGSTKWVNGYYGPDRPVLNNTTNYAYNTWSNIVVNNGVADIYARDVSSNPIYYAPYNKYYNYTSGAISCKYDDVAYSSCTANGGSIDNKGFLYGMFEIKCKMPKGSGRLAAFWFYGAWETDVFEFDGGNPNTFSSTMHYDGASGRTACSTYAEKVSSYDLTEDYHVYTMVWTPTAMTYFFDGREVRTDTQLDRIPRGCEWRRMVMCIDSEIWWNPSNLSSPFSIDYVRVYKPINNDPTNPAATYANAPYKRSTAINTINCLNWGAQAATKLTGACYPSGPGVPTKEIAVNNTQVFYRTDNNNMMTLYFDNGVWNNVGLDWNVNNVAGNVTTSKTATNVFYSDAAGRMFNFWWDSNGWHNAGLDGNITDVSNNVVTANQGTGVIYRNKSGGLSNFWFDNGWHNAPIYQASNVSSCEGSVAIWDNNIFYKGTDNKLYYIQYTSSGWSTAVQIAAASNVSNSLVLEVDPLRPGFAGYRVYYIGTNNNVYNAYLENGQWVSYSLDWHINNAASDLCAYNGQVYYRGTDNRLWNHYFYEGAWRVNPINYSTTPAVRGGVCMGNDGRVFFVDTNRYIFNAYAAASRFVDLACNSSGAISNRGSVPTGGEAAMQAEKVNQAEASSGARLLRSCASVGVYDKFGNKLKTAACSDFDGAIGNSFGLAPGFYVLRFMDDAGQVIKTEKTIITE